MKKDEIVDEIIEELKTIRTRVDWLCKDAEGMRDAASRLLVRISILIRELYGDDENPFIED
jgi:hypothetical protein